MFLKNLGFHLQFTYKKLKTFIILFYGCIEICIEPTALDEVGSSVPRNKFRRYNMQAVLRTYRCIIVPSSSIPFLFQNEKIKRHSPSCPVGRPDPSLVTTDFSLLHKENSKGQSAVGPVHFIKCLFCPEMTVKGRQSK